MSYSTASVKPCLWRARTEPLWYDALTAITDLIDATPSDPAPRRRYTDLPAQLGLRRSAERNMRRSRPREPNGPAA